MYRTLKLDVTDAIATVTLNRPEARNAMSAELMREMIACAREVAVKVRALPINSVRMSKESVHAYANIGAHAASHMAHDQVQLAAGSAEARAARDAFAKRKKGARPARSRSRDRR